MEVSIVIDWRDLQADIVLRKKNSVERYYLFEFLNKDKLINRSFKQTYFPKYKFKETIDPIKHLEVLKELLINAMPIIIQEFE
jgi:hypothetical protein